MLSIKLINLYSNMSALANYSTILFVIPPAIPFAIFFAFVVSTLFAPAAFIE